jgi:hypothetical protein
MRSFADLDLATRSPDFADFVWRAANLEHIPIAQRVKPATESKIQIPSSKFQATSEFTMRNKRNRR